MELKLDQRSKAPLHQQIADQVRRLVATEKLLPGDRLPPVRQLASSLNVNQNTVLKAYWLLEQESVVIARGRGGTVVTAKTDDPKFVSERQRHLLEVLNNVILNALSMGYSPESVETAFRANLARWCEERQTPARTPQETEAGTKAQTIKVVGSYDLALNILTDLAQKRSGGVECQLTHDGSLGGLLALQEERAHLAAIHLLDEETGDYNYPYVKRILSGREVAMVHLAYRIQGLMVARGNPKQIKGLEDLPRPDIIFVNRRKGAGTRVLLDVHLRQLGIHPSRINGYERELDTHLAVGLSVARGEADTALGIEAAARSCDLDFIPLFRERYDLVMSAASYRSRLLSPLLSTVNSDEFKTAVDKAGGYDTSQTGMATFI